VLAEVGTRARCQPVGHGDIVAVVLVTRTRPSRGW
jgi:hypothetical protein